VEQPVAYASTPLTIRTPNLEKLGNEDLVEGLSNHGVTSQKISKYE
jgi:hypothetical protein